MSDHLYEYLDDLLRLQSIAADRHNHNGVLGAVREDFVIQILKNSVDEIKLHTGEVICTCGDLGQQDIIVRRRGTLNTSLGGQIRLPANECAGVIEVKSNAKGNEITKFEGKSKLIKQDNPDAICGLVCYKLNCRKDTILNRLGYEFEEFFEGFVPSGSIEREYNYIDFIFCLDEEIEDRKDCFYNKAFFIKKNIQGKYDLFLDPPFIKYFLLEINAVSNPVK